MPTEKEYMLKKDDAETTYQKKLTAGSNITIDPVTNTISSTGGNTVSSTEAYQYGDILNTLTIDGVNHYVKTPSLIAGPNVNITRNQETGALTISATGGGSSNVIPNPEGVPADVLETIGIGNIIYRIASIVELTEDEYEDLPSSKNTDDVMYLLLENEDIFNGGSTISLVDTVGITIEETSVLGGRGFVDAYESSAGYEGFNIALQNLTVGNTYKLEFDFQFTDAQFIGTTDYRCAYLISQSAKTDYSNYTSWTENLARDLLNHHHSVSFTATATTMHISFNLSGCSDDTDNYFIIDNMICLDVAKTYKIMYNGNQYGGGSNTNITSGTTNPSEGEENDVYYKYSYTTERLEDEITLPTFESDVSTHINITDFNKYLNVKFMYHDIYSSMNTKILSIADLPETNNPGWGQGGDVYTFNGSHYVVCGKDSTGLWIKEDGDLLKKIYCQYDLYDYTVIDEYVKIEDAWVKVNSISINPSGQTVGKLTSFSYDDEIYDTKEVKTGTTNPSNGYADDVYYKYEYTVDTLEDEITLPTIPASTSTHVDIPNFNKYTNIKFIYHDIYGTDTTTILSVSSIPETNNPTVDNVFDWNYTYYIACGKDSTGLWIKQGRDLLQKIYCQYDVYNYTVTDHYVKLNDTWVKIDTGGGGASAISDLTDVNLTDLSDGQILKYNSTSQKWENANESGGGSSGSSEATVIFNTFTSTTGEITLSDDITNYTDLEFYIKSSSDGTTMVYRVNVQEFMREFPNVANPNESTPHFLPTIWSQSGCYSRIIMGTANNKLLVYQCSSQGIDKIVGIKSGGGSGSGGLKSTTLYSSQTYSATLSLSDDYTNYDYILLEGFDSNNGGYAMTSIVPTSDLIINNHIGISNDAYFAWYKITSSTSLSIDGKNSDDIYISKIYGLKSSGGSGDGSGYSETVLWFDLTGVNADPTDPQTITLSDNLSNYDFIYIDTTPDKQYDVINHNNTIVPVSSIDTTGTNSIALNCLGQDIDYIPILFYDDDTHLILSAYNASGEFPITYWKIVGIKIGGGGNVDDVYVNGESVLDTDKIAQVKTHKEVSLAEYEDANDDIIYFVDDDDDELGIYYSPIIYSTEEREVGTWTNGKPLYEKTIYIGSMTKNSSWNSIAHNINDIEKVIKLWGQTKQSSDGRMYNIPHYRPYDNTGISIGADTTYVYYMNTWLEYASDTYVTIQYTKTTDTPGSAKYNALGVPMMHYSTDEQVIGTWIDGKPLYQKTYYYNNQSGLIDGDNKIIQLDSAINVTKLNGFLVAPDNNKMWILPYSKGSSTTAIIITEDHYINLYVSNDSWASTRKVYITIEYTKTTD